MFFQVLHHPLTAIPELLNSYTDFTDFMDQTDWRAIYIQSMSFSSFKCYP